MTTRRSFLGGMAGILASGFAPAAVGSGILMPVKKIALASFDDLRLYGGARGGGKQNVRLLELIQNSYHGGVDMANGPSRSAFFIMRGDRWEPFDL